ncbi:hypothetical protein CEXT_135011 [Caerostris extrusa]|uniref:Uncharacterized protein n=1 Tax=Caerostris extrusa TaxID=172846 RepID=A0AAV4W379_CAEEX|nr:hypothetical protein CEXT_135011 [Caerostris extrusa]
MASIHDKTFAMEGKHGIKTFAMKVMDTQLLNARLPKQPAKKEKLHTDKLELFGIECKATLDMQDNELSASLDNELVESVSRTIINIAENAAVATAVKQIIY